MGKRSRKEAGDSGSTTIDSHEDKKVALWNEKAVDPTLAQLFASSVSSVITGEDTLS